MQRIVGKHHPQKEAFMRHLMSPLDFSVEELDRLLDLANDIEKIRKNMNTSATANELLHFL